MANNLYGFAVLTNIIRTRLHIIAYCNGMVRLG